MNGIIFEENDKVLEFNIVGYEFEEIDERYDEYDANWLNVRIMYRDLENSFDLVDPCILTFELKELVEEINILIKKKTKLIKTFTEPNLSFEIMKVENYYKFKIKFLCDTLSEMKSVYVCKILTLDELVEVKEELKRMYTKFPERK